MEFVIVGSEFSPTVNVVAVGFIVDGPSYGRCSIVEACPTALKRNESLTGTQLSDIANNVMVLLEPMTTSPGLGYAWSRTGNHTSAALKRSCCVKNPSKAKELEGLMPQFGPSSSNGIPVVHNLERSPFEVAKLAMENYLSLLKRNELTSEQLYDIEVNIGLLATAMMDDGEHTETINLLMNELCTLLTSRTRNLQCQSQSHASQSIGDGNREGGRNPALESVLDDLSELTMRYYKGKGIELRKVMDIGCRIKKLGREKFCLPKKLEGLMSRLGSTSSLLTRNGIPPINPVHTLQRARKGTGSVWEGIPLGDENVASTITPSNINNSPHQSSVPDTDNERVGAAGCCWRTAGLKNILSYPALNAQVKVYSSSSSSSTSRLISMIA